MASTSLRFARSCGRLRLLRLGYAVGSGRHGEPARCSGAVVDLAKYAGISADTPRDIMIVTEYNGHTQGFLVESVDTILRLDWSKMRVPPEMLTARPAVWLRR